MRVCVVWTATLERWGLFFKRCSDFSLSFASCCVCVFGFKLLFMDAHTTWLTLVRAEEAADVLACEQHASGTNSLALE